MPKAPNTKKITPALIRQLSYPDFVGFINQWNTPPGSYSTLSKLAIFSGMTKASRILEVGCSTGFSSREFALMSGCSGVGFDRSKNSIAMANFNKKKYAPGAAISYEVADGYEFKPKGKKFTHIMVGGNLKFFSNPEKMLSRCVGMINDGGFVLATPYYQVRPVPPRLARRMHDSLGIPLNAFADFSYKETMKLYNKFEIVYENRNALTRETEGELKYYCASVIDRACGMRRIDDREVYDEMYKRLLAVRRLINESRRYQEYDVLVLRYRKSVYPRRYVGLF
ncbi:MAG: class I SAM-dependent methyltransferase [Minisyncoccia bacterium]|jgi:ubiquinone/menaquinone biosynthesis C-methylase UbiE